MRGERGLRGVGERGWMRGKKGERGEVREGGGGNMSIERMY